ncbi:MAG TPA: hypothetical protein VFC26_06135 [Verrucomicrobiae bacterium]|nr:hypothetical protein [Verrucomicrobiae bacterium]
MRWVVIILVLAVGAAAGLGWRKAMVLQQENTLLRIQIEELKQQAAAAADDREQSQNAELKKLRAENQELVKLRGEVSQLRMGAKETEKLRAELSAIRSQNQQLQAQAVAAPAPPTNPAPEQFPRQSWAFSGYASPESALVSAIWAMREGKPQVFLDSLSPEEQQRMAQTWQGKSEEEIAAKHQGDVGNIQGLRILNRTPVSPSEVQMQVFLEGANRVETFKMTQGADQQWKFGGFIRK